MPKRRPEPFYWQVIMRHVKRHAEEHRRGKVLGPIALKEMTENPDGPIASGLRALLPTEVEFADDRALFGLPPLPRPRGWGLTRKQSKAFFASLERQHQAELARDAARRLKRQRAKGGASAEGPAP